MKFKIPCIIILNIYVVAFNITVDHLAIDSKHTFY
jgi:hypothetical protein